MDALRKLISKRAENERIKNERNEPNLDKPDQIEDIPPIPRRSEVEPPPAATPAEPDPNELDPSILAVTRGNRTDPNAASSAAASGKKGTPPPPKKK